MRRATAHPTPTGGPVAPEALPPPRSRDGLALVLAPVVGAAAGLTAVGTDAAISALRHLGRGRGGVLGAGFGPAAAVVLVVGAGAAALILVWTRSVPEARGVPLVMEAESADPRGLPDRAAWWRAVAAALAIGTGSSAGHEGPSVLLGAALAERVGRRVGLDAEAARRLIAAGAAAAIAASVHLPLVAGLFVLEVLLPRRDLRALLAVASGATVGWTIWSVLVGPRRLTLGDQPLTEESALVAAAAIGVAAAAASMALTYGIIGGDRLRTRSGLGPVARILLGAVVVAGLGLALGPVLGSGQVVTPTLLRGSGAATPLLLALVVGKVVATSVTLGSGLPGGAFTPAVLVGAASGALVAQAVLGGTPAEVRACAVVGAAAALAALARAPLTAVALLVEVAGGFALLPAGLVAVAVALVLVSVSGATRLYDAATG